MYDYSTIEERLAKRARRKLRSDVEGAQAAFYRALPDINGVAVHRDDVFRNHDTLTVTSLLSFLGRAIEQQITEARVNQEREDFLREVDELKERVNALSEMRDDDGE